MIFIIALVVEFFLLCFVVPNIVHSSLRERRVVMQPLLALFSVGEVVIQYWWLFASGLALILLTTLRIARSSELNRVWPHNFVKGYLFALVGLSLAVLMFTFGSVAISLVIAMAGA